MKLIFIFEYSECKIYSPRISFIGYARVEISEGKFRTSGIPITRPPQDCIINSETRQYICNDTWTWEWDENQGYYS